MKQLNFHLISDHSVDALIAISKEATGRFQSVKVQENLWPFTNTAEKLLEVTAKIDKTSFVLYTIQDDLIREALKDFCRKSRIPCVPILSRIVRELSSYLKEKPSDGTTGEYEVFTDDYFARIDAMNYVLSHDDGQNMWDIEEADIIIIGVSRTSKSPTSVYLSYRGYKVANIPFVSNIPMPENLIKFEDKLIVGLTINPDRLTEIRKNRLVTTQNYDNTIYADRDEVLGEINQARRFFAENNWPVIDVTNRSVEEIASAIMQEYNTKRMSV